MNFSIPHHTAINVPGTQGRERSCERWKEEPKQVGGGKAEGTSLGVEAVTESTHFYSISKLESNGPCSQSSVICLEDRVKRSQQEPACWAGYHVENLISKPQARSLIAIIFQ